LPLAPPSGQAWLDEFGRVKYKCLVESARLISYGERVIACVNQSYKIDTGAVVLVEPRGSNR
jgi:hypothetical protein